MIIDGEQILTKTQAVSASAVGQNSISLLQDRAIGSGTPMAVLFTVEVAADQTTGDETYQFDVEYASNAAQTTGRQLIGRRVFQAGAPTAPNQDADLLVAGFSFAIPIPPTQRSESELFLGVRFTPSGTTPTITCSAYLVPLSMIDAGVIYPKGYTVS